MLSTSFHEQCSSTDSTGAHIGRDSQSLSIGQSQKLVVIQHTVQILNPLWVHISVEYDPLSLVELTTYIVYDPIVGVGEGERVCEVIG